MLRSFLATAAKILKPSGEIQITLKSDEHYKQWQLPFLIEKESNVVFKRTHVMTKSLFPGYVHRPTLGTFGRHLTEVPDRKGAKVHVFVSKSSHTEESNIEESNVNSVSIVTPDEDSLPCLTSRFAWDPFQSWTLGRVEHLTFSRFAMPLNMLFLPIPGS